MAAAAATAYLRALIGDTPAAWLNIGIAGHGSQAVGTALLAHKVVDAASGKPFYPTFAPPPCRTTLLRTVDRVQSPAGDAAYDMEASGFCEPRTLCHQRASTASRSSPTTRNLPIRLNAERVEAAQLDMVAQVSEHLRTSATPRATRRPSANCPLAIRHQLRLLARWQTLAPATPAVNDDLLALQRRDEVLAHLKQRLDEVGDKRWTEA